MRLLDYMKRNKIDDDAMAALVGTDTSARAVRKWKYLETTPPLQKLLKIQEVTAGEVAPEDFLPAASADPGGPPSERSGTATPPAAVPTKLAGGVL